MMEGFLKCDANGCGHVEAVQAITSDLVGSECPKCGANLLTQEDYNMHVSVLQPLLESLVDAGITRPATPEEIEAGIGILGMNYHDGELRISLSGFNADGDKNED